MDTNFESVTSPRSRGKYRQHSLEFKRALVERALQPGASVSRIAREHNLNTNLVFSWRKLYLAGCLGPNAPAQAAGLLPVIVAAPSQCQTQEPTPNPAGSITLEIGQVRLRIDGQANAATLAQVLALVLR
jgi:transposase